MRWAARMGLGGWGSLQGILEREGEAVHGCFQSKRGLVGAHSGRDTQLENSCSTSRDHCPTRWKALEAHAAALGALFMG